MAQFNGLPNNYDCHSCLRNIASANDMISTMWDSSFNFQHKNLRVLPVLSDCIYVGLHDHNGAKRSLYNKSVHHRCRHHRHHHHHAYIHMHTHIHFHTHICTLTHTNAHTCTHIDTWAYTDTSSYTDTWVYTYAFEESTPLQDGGVVLLYQWKSFIRLNSLSISNGFARQSPLSHITWIIPLPLRWHSVNYRSVRLGTLYYIA